MGRMLDKGSQNPRIQCGECGRWKRLHGVKDGKAVQRFFGSCEITEGDHPCGQEVCSDCCPGKCLITLAETPTTSETPGVHKDEKLDARIMAARATLSSQERS